jgi:3-hydroxy-9,10-secoandrosta-1,3,5(10)-triene-9,17-dione monooxygenase
MTSGEKSSFLTVPGDSVSVRSAAREAVAVLRQFDQQADADSRLPAASEAALLNAGMFRLAVPASLGGHEASVRACLEVTAMLARGCPAASWITAISYGAQQLAASFGEKVRSDLWGDSPDVPLCGSFNAVGATVTRVEGGQVASGKWPWSSGAYQARWALLAMPTVDEADQVTGQGLAIIPLADLTIENTWDMAGMRGTGSNTLVAEQCFVPDYRIRPFAQILVGAQAPTEPLYRVPAGAITITLMGPLLGAAEEIFDLTMEVVASGKPMASSFYRSLADSPGIQGSLADAATLIDSARLHLFRSADYIDKAAADGAVAADGSPDLSDGVARARVRMDIGYAAKCLREAASLLLSIGGASAFKRGNAMQRLWRDLETGSRQPTLSTDLSREMYGRALVGAPTQVSPLV